MQNKIGQIEHNMVEHNMGNMEDNIGEQEITDMDSLEPVDNEKQKKPGCVPRAEHDKTMAFYIKEIERREKIIETLKAEKSALLNSSLEQARKNAELKEELNKLTKELNALSSAQNTLKLKRAP